MVRWLKRLGSQGVGFGLNGFRVYVIWVWGFGLPVVPLSLLVVLGALPKTMKGLLFLGYWGIIGDSH